MGNLLKRPITQVRPVAEALVERLRPACERIEIAGSIRRGRAEVGDIELVAIPKIQDQVRPEQGTLFSLPRPPKTARENQLWDAVDGLGVTCTKRGPVYRQFEWRGVRVDVFTCEQRNWGWALFHRTGPAYLRRKIGMMFVENGYAAVEGWIWDARSEKTSIDKVDTPEEEDIFRLLGIPYLPPDQRDRLKQA